MLQDTVPVAIRHISGQRLVVEVQLMPDGDICPVAPPGCQLNIDNSEVIVVREVPTGIPGSPLSVLVSRLWGGSLPSRTSQRDIAFQGSFF